jgi:hypothetical protein
MKEVTAIVVFAVDVTTKVGTDITPGALREMILVEAEHQIRSGPPINAPVIVKSSEPIVDEHKRFLRLGRGQKTLPATAKSAPSRSGSKTKGVAK